MLSLITPRWRTPLAKVVERIVKNARAYKSELLWTKLHTAEVENEQSSEGQRCQQVEALSALWGRPGPKGPPPQAEQQPHVRRRKCMVSIANPASQEAMFGLAPSLGLDMTIRANRGQSRELHPIS